ncbi:MAG TPA: hypothetical protein VI112_15405 [Bacteroidia bacterium]
MRYALSFIILICSVTTARPQNISMGFYLNPDYSVFSISPAPQTPRVFSKKTFGLGIGLLARYDVNDKFSLFTGLGRFSRGIHFIAEEGANVSEDFKLFFPSFEIPVGLSYRFHLAGKTWLKLTGAAVPDLLRMKDSELNTGINDSTVVQKLYFHDGLSLLVSGGVQFEFEQSNGGRYFIGCALYKSLKTVMETDVSIYPYSSDPRSNHYTYDGSFISFEFGYFFPVKKKKEEPEEEN